MQEKIAVVGLGYVGLPVALAFADRFPDTVGFDISAARITELKHGREHTGEVAEERLGASPIRFTSDPADLAPCKFFIVAVPTPIDAYRTPDVKPLVSASTLLGKWLTADSVVVYESTVYPGLTEEICLPLLEQGSGLTGGKDFFIGYSPERINPGDKVHTLRTVIKIVAGENPAVTDLLADVYGSVVEAGVHRASSIKVAEAAKVIENTQRDINIALMRYGTTQAILAGDALLALANRRVAEYDRPELTTILSEALLQTATGEILEIVHLRDTDLPLSAYLNIITGKTAYLIQAACQCGAVLAKAGPDLTQAAIELGLNCGIAFQLVDDALDYTSPANVSGKPTGGDLKEGKVTLPFILYLADLPFEARQRLAEDFRQDQLSVEDIEYLRGNIVSGGYAEKTREMAATYLRSAQDALGVFPSSLEADLIGQVLAPMLRWRALFTALLAGGLFCGPVFPVRAQSESPSPAGDQVVYVGSAACKDCHARILHPGRRRTVAPLRRHGPGPGHRPARGAPARR